MKLPVQCECEGTGWVAQIDSVGEDTEFIECVQHHPSFAPTAKLIAFFKGTAGQYRSMSQQFALSYIDTNAAIRNLHLY